MNMKTEDVEKCFLCGSEIATVLNVAGDEKINLCTKHSHNNYYCDSCGITIRIAEDYFSIVNKEMYCTDCAPHISIKECSKCGERTNINANWYREFSGVLCKKCVHDKISTLLCDICEKKIDIRKREYVNVSRSVIVCNNCIPDEEQKQVFNNEKLNMPVQHPSSDFSDVSDKTLIDGLIYIVEKINTKTIVKQEDRESLKNIKLELIHRMGEVRNDTSG